jgi:hypothetical protein
MNTQIVLHNAMLSRVSEVRWILNTTPVIVRCSRASKRAFNSATIWAGANRWVRGLAMPDGQENFNRVCRLGIMSCVASQVRTHSYMSSGTRLKKVVWSCEAGTYATEYSRRKAARGIAVCGNKLERVIDNERGDRVVRMVSRSRKIADTSSGGRES